MGKYHCTIDFLFDWFGLVCFANKNKNCQLSYSKFQTNQTGGQWYSDASPFSIPWSMVQIQLLPLAREKIKMLEKHIFNFKNSNLNQVRQNKSRFNLYAIYQ
jgi:hypothetical protein